jgi:hypothetical protein
MHMRKVTHASFAAVGFMALAGVANAGIVASDSFAEPVGAIAGQGAGVGWGANTWDGTAPLSGQIVAGDLSYPALVASDNHFLLGTQDARRPFASPLTPASYPTLYVSFLIQRPSSDTAWGGVSLFNGGAEQLYVGNEGSKWGFENKLDNNNGAKGIGADNDGNAHFLVVGMNFTTKTVSMWVDPVPGSTEGTSTGSYTDSSISNFVFTQVGLRGDSTQSGLLAIDELRIGTTFADVTPPVPEPAMLSLLAAGGLLFCRRPRRASSHAA